jgi:hypothetical protein
MNNAQQSQEIELALAAFDRAINTLDGETHTVIWEYGAITIFPPCFDRLFVFNQHVDRAIISAIISRLWFHKKIARCMIVQHGKRSELNLFIFRNGEGLLSDTLNAQCMYWVEELGRNLKTQDGTLLQAAEAICDSWYNRKAKGDM